MHRDKTESRSRPRFVVTKLCTAQVEAAMVEALHHVCTQGVAQYPTVPRIDWVLNWPGQIVLVVTAIFWTKSVGDAIASGTPGALKALAQSNTSDLNDIVSKVRSSDFVLIRYNIYLNTLIQKIYYIC